jgi:hypothetical protein
MWSLRIGACGLALLALSVLPVAMTDRVSAQQPTPEQIEAVRENCRSDFISHCSGVQPGGREALQCLQRNAAQLSSGCSSAVGAVAPNPEPVNAASAASSPQPPQPTDQDQLAAVRRACTLDDVASHCSWIQVTNPELLLCLRANAAALSPACQAVLRVAPATAAPTLAPTVTPPAPPAAPTVATTPPPAPVASPSPPPTAAKGTTAPAQPSAKQISAIRSSCRSDFMSRCSGVQPGTREALECLERNKASVSRPCQAALAAVGGNATGATPSSESAAPAAMTSPTAPESFPVRRLAPRQELGILRACAADVRSLCDGTTPGGGRIIACLARNASQLSPQCRGALEQVRG